MRKFTAIVFSVIMCAVIACSFALTAFAENTAFEINALNMSIPVPNDMYVVTRESSESDPFFSKFNLDYKSTLAQLEEGNIFLEGINEDSSLTLSVTMTRTDESISIGSYNTLSDEELTNIMEKLRENSVYKDASPVVYRDIKYICLNMSYKSGEKSVQAQQYNTVMNGENINITLQAAPGQKLSTENKEMLTGIIQETVILNDNFFNRNKSFILYASITLAAIAIVVVAFVLILKYIRNPDRKHKILVHELAHEHKITETTQIPRKHIMDVIQPTNSFLLKYDPIDELGKGKRKKKKKNANTVADEVREITSYSEAVPEEAVQPADSVAYEDAAEEIAVAVEAEEVKEQIAAEIETTEAAIEEDTPAEEEQTETPEEAETVSEENAEAPIQEAQQSGESFDGVSDYFEDVPDENQMYAYSDVDTAVEDYSAAKRRAEREEIDEDGASSAETAKKVLFTIGRGIATVFRTIFVVIIFIVTHLRYFCINLYRLIKRKRAQTKHRKIEEERKRKASERRRMEREAERARQIVNARRGENDLIKVHSSTERRAYPSSRQPRRTAYPSKRSSQNNSYRR